VDKLIRAKYQDNLEFCQWMKAFYEQSGSPMRENYDASAVRERGKDGKQYNTKMGRASAATIKRGSTRTTAAPSRPTTDRTTNSRPATTSSSRPSPPVRPTASATTSRNSVPTAAAPKAVTQPLKERTANPPVYPNDDGKDKATIAELEALNTELVEKTEELTVQNEDLIKRCEFLEEAVLETEGERDFYFEKLRNVEVFLQIRGETCDAKTLIEDVFKILYATKEADVMVNDDGEVVPANGKKAESSVLADDGFASEDADAISLGDVMDG
jgi:microtubule-associated protein, RP/EB family